MMLQHCHVESPIGTLTLVRTDGVLSGLYLPDHLRGPSPTTLGTQTDFGFDDIRMQLTEYFDGQRTCFDLPLAPAGTTFQQAVWTLLRAIPHGETRTYGQLADQLGKPLAVRAVGLANGRNPISIVIPCHRVIGSDGSLTGYAGGVWRKRHLLELEAQSSRQLHLY